MTQFIGSNMTHCLAILYPGLLSPLDCLGVSISLTASSLYPKEPKSQKGQNSCCNLGSAAQRFMPAAVSNLLPELFPCLAFASSIEGVVLSFGAVIQSDRALLDRTCHQMGWPFGYEGPILQSQFLALSDCSSRITHLGVFISITHLGFLISDSSSRMTHFKPALWPHSSAAAVF